MEERVDEIRPISRVRPVRKLALVKPRRGRRELMYQLKRYNKAQKFQRNNSDTIKSPDVQKDIKASTVLKTNDLTDLKKRAAYDRAVIFGD